MVWKEMQPQMRSRWARLFFSLLAILSLIPAVIILAQSSQYPAGPRALAFGPQTLADYAQLYVQIVGTMAACALLLSIMLRSSGALTTEREKETLDALLTTPLSRSQILFGKWLGNILALRRTALLWLGTIWLFGLATGGLHILGVIALTIVLGVHAAAWSSIGLAASAMSRSSMRAHVTALLMTLALVLCPLLPLFLVAATGDQGFMGQYLEFVAFGLIAPVTIGGAAFSNKNVADGLHCDGNAISYAIVGLLIWASIAVFFYRAAGNSFLGRRFKVAGHRPAAKEEVAVGTAEGGG